MLLKILILWKGCFAPNIDVKAIYNGVHIHLTLFILGEKWPFYRIFSIVGSPFLSEFFSVPYRTSIVLKYTAP